MKNFVLNFSTLDTNTNNFMIFQLQYYLQIFAILTYFVKIWNINAHKKKLWLTIFNFFLTTIRTNPKERCIKFSSFFGNPNFFYRRFKKKFSKKSKTSVAYK